MDHNQYREQLAAHLQGSENHLPPDELATRLRRLRAGMAERELHAVLLTNPAEIHYYSGYSTFEVSVHTALLITANQSVLQVPSIETGPAVTTAVCDQIIGYLWEAPETVTEPLLELLGAQTVLGLDTWSPGLRAGLARQLEHHLGADRIRPVGDLVQRQRRVKSAYEINLLQRSADLTSIGLQAAIDCIRPGVTEQAIAAQGARALLAAGSEFMSLQPIVTSGPRTSVIHLNHSARKVSAGEPVFLEFGAAFRRYTAPMMRTAVAGDGPPGNALLRLRDLCSRLQDTLCRTMRPGHSFDEAARAAEKILAPSVDEVFFSGVFGYAVGAQFPPSWVEGTGYIARDQTPVFEPGMVFHLPLCLRQPGYRGVGLSNTVVVGTQGARPLTDNDFTLAVRG
ncbi:aminopeptidase P family protein [Natronospirillum operosum]|uniref:Aminopeptidase P family protein n=1 Tax=Natronospirillum operosum TaxID=2759953 RepID=A0A4Z0WG52_9GAMM|nr:Xaa-Pro peptidase family protein [Natronospirillum operosum]TGG94206.1 aminopeptidase P family protein [Natronospirillum operosum]